MKFSQYVRFVGFWKAVKDFLLFPFWLIYNFFVYMPNLKREVAAQNGVDVCTEDMLNEYCSKKLPPLPPLWEKSFNSERKGWVDTHPFRIIKIIYFFKYFSKNLPVYDSSTLQIFSGVPSATIVPPASPPSGPKSIM